MNKTISLACRIRQECVKMGPEMINLLGIGVGIDQPQKNSVWSPPKFKLSYFCISLNVARKFFFPLANSLLYCKIRQRQILFCDNAKCDVLSSNSMTPNSTPWFQIRLPQILCGVPISKTPSSVSPNSVVHKFILSNSNSVPLHGIQEQQIQHLN